MQLAEHGETPQGMFGNAVDVALTLFRRTPAQKLLSWDLDGDRGVGWPTWLLKDGIGPAVVRE